ncbi:MAG: hypothetical protein ACTSRZ_20340, partial [Promethearchaeota archaeon]
MIKEVINFMKYYRDISRTHPPVNKDFEIDQLLTKYKNIIIINIDPNFDLKTLQYNDFIALSSDSNSILRNIHPNFNEDYTTWLNNNRYILKELKFQDFLKPMSDRNKALGGNQSLQSFSLFHFKISSFFTETKSGLRFRKKKIEKHKISTDIARSIKDRVISNLNNNHQIEITRIILEDNNQEIRKIISIFIDNFLNRLGLEKINSLSSNNDNRNNLIKQRKNIFVYLNIHGGENLPRLFLQAYLENKLISRRESLENNSFCPICQSNNIDIACASSFNTLNVKKPFVLHYDRLTPYNLRICIDCLKLLNNFETFLNETKDFFPLFLNEKIQKEEINFLKKENKKTFFDIIEHIYYYQKEGLQDFILIKASGGDIEYFDYISNCAYYFKGRYHHYFKHYEDSERLSIKKLYSKISDKDFLNLKSNLFFGKISSSKAKIPSFKKHLIFKYRKKIFDTIYKNKINCLTVNDIKEICLSFVENTILNKEVKEKTNLIKNKFLDFYLNSILFIKNPDKFIKLNKRGKNMLEKIREEKKNISAFINEQDDLKEFENFFRINSDEKFGYYLGQFVYYLIEKSKAGNKMSLLTPILSCKTIENLRRVIIEKYFEKYGRELSDYKDFRHVLIADILDYLKSEVKSPFNDIKLSFY